MSETTSPARILVVDDDPDTRAIVRHFLTNWGYDVEQADNGKHALERVAESPPELVLLDLEMPEMDGFETCARLKSNPETEWVPVVVFTGLDQLPSKRLRKIEESADDYIVKSAEPDELRSRIATVLARGQELAKLKSPATEPTPAAEQLSLEEVPFPDALQIALAHRRDGVIEVRDEGEAPRSGWVMLREGRIVHAECGGESGEEALYGFALWSHGSFEFRETDPGSEQTIDTPTRSLLVESSRRGDAWRWIASKVPSFDYVPTCVPLQDASSIRLSRSDWAVLRLSDGRRSIADIVDAIGTDLFEAGRVVYSLVTVGVLRLDPPPPEGSALGRAPRRGGEPRVDEPFELDAREWELLVHADGERDLETIRRSLGMTATEALETAKALRDRGLLI